MRILILLMMLMFVVPTITEAKKSKRANTWNCSGKMSKNYRVKKTSYLPFAATHDRKINKRTGLQKKNFLL